MKVLVVSHGFQEHYTIGFANGLARSGIHVLLVHSRTLDSTALDPAIRSVDLGQNTGERYSALHKGARFLKYHVSLLVLAITHFNSNIHVIGLLRHELLTGVIEGLVFRLLSKRFVLTVHNLLPHDQHTAWNRFLYGVIYRIPHVLIVHTPKMREELVSQFGIRVDRIQILEHGLNDAVPDHERTMSQCREALGIPQSAFALLFFGRIAPYKGLDTLLEAFQMLRSPCHLVVAGAPISATYGAEIRQLIDNHPSRSAITCVLDWIADKDIATWFRACDCLVMPYRHIDQSGLVFLSLRFGLPLISFDVGSVRDYIGEGIGLVVEENTSQALANSIDQFRANSADYSRQAIAEYSKRFSWEHVIASLAYAYKD